MTDLPEGPFDIHVGDCREVLAAMPENSFDACVTDPPYHLTSIVKRFGGSNAAPAKSNGATGVYKRASTGFMGQQWDGGGVAFDPETWVEVMRVLKPGAHLVAFGGSRTYHRLACAIEDAGFEIRDQIMWLYGSGFPKSHNQKDDWTGWGTALKPAHEPIVLARKPFKTTVAKNLAEHGCGALNIDGCRVDGNERPHVISDRRLAHNTYSPGLGGSKASGTTTEGRWPANVCHDGSDEVVVGFPDSKGQQGDVRGTEPSGKTDEIHGAFDRRTPAPARRDSGSAARFFYCAKASKKDRDDGNNHPTVKPTALMQWLCRLITPPGGVVLDPFMGSGSTGRAAILEGFRFTGIEQDEGYSAIARARIKAAHREARIDRGNEPDLFAWAE